jgi:hypothetical protein
MSDNISYNLADHYNIAKYLPWSSKRREDAVLIRRAEENTSVVKLAVS